MVDLTPIKEYLDKGSLNGVGFAVSTISRIGFNEWFKGQLEVFCNCTRTFKDGRRCTQTNDLRYSIELFTTVEMIEAYGEDKKDDYYNQLLNQHKVNLEFEAVNGLEYDPNPKKKEKKTNTTKRKPKQTSININNKPKKETAAERKLKAHAIKLNALTFKPKTIDNGNTI